jgi:hypothetical protein
VPRVGASLAVAARTLLLLLGLFPSVLGRLMMTDYAAGAGADNAVMPGIVPATPPTAAPFRQLAACAGTQPAARDRHRSRAQGPQISGKLGENADLTTLHDQRR